MCNEIYILDTDESKCPFFNMFLERNIVFSPLNVAPLSADLSLPTGAPLIEEKHCSPAIKENT